jgi:hypothetical protein
MIGAHIELILIVTGALTAIALLQLIAPASVIRMIFGEAPTNEVGLAVARHWGLLIFLIGGLLVYAAFHPSVRSPAIVVAVIEKAALGLGVFGTSLRTHPAAATIAAGDSLIALIYILYLVGF